MDSEVYYPKAVDYFPDQNEYLKYVREFLNDCNNTEASQTTWIVKIVHHYEDEIPHVTRAAFKSDNYYSVEDIFLDWWEYTKSYDQVEPGFHILEVEIFTNYSPSDICAPRLADWLKKNLAVTKLTIYFAFVHTWDEQRRDVSRAEYIQRLKILKESKQAVKILKVNNSVLKNWANSICPSSVPFRVYYQDTQYKNRDLEKDVVTWSQRTLRVNSFPNEERFQWYVSKFLHDCNDSGALDTIWIVRVKEFSGYEDPVVKRAAFRNDGYNFVQDNFMHWWENQYEQTVDPEDGRTEVQIFTNYTPTEICAPQLINWLKRNKNVTKLTIYFAFFYTWNAGRRKVPEEEYVRRLEELRTSTDRIVNIGKVDAWILKMLANDADVPFSGYDAPWYSNQRFEMGFMTDPDLM